MIPLSLSFLIIDILMHLLDFRIPGVEPIFIVSFLEYIAIHFLLFLVLLTIDVWRVQHRGSELY